MKVLKSASHRGPKGGKMQYLQVRIDSVGENIPHCLRQRKCWVEGCETIGLGYYTQEKAMLIRGISEWGRCLTFPLIEALSQNAFFLRVNKLSMVRKIILRQNTELTS